jgi:hypothetical protein
VFSYTANFIMTLASNLKICSEIYMPYCARVREAKKLRSDYPAMLILTAGRSNTQKETIDWVRRCRGAPQVCAAQLHVGARSCSLYRRGV